MSQNPQYKVLCLIKNRLSIDVSWLIDWLIVKEGGREGGRKGSLVKLKDYPRYICSIFRIYLITSEITQCETKASPDYLTCLAYAYIHADQYSASRSRSLVLCDCVTFFNCRTKWKNLIGTLKEKRKVFYFSPWNWDWMGEKLPLTGPRDKLTQAKAEEVKLRVAPDECSLIVLSMPLVQPGRASFSLRGAWRYSNTVIQEQYHLTHTAY